MRTRLDRPNRSICLRMRGCLRISWAAGSGVRCLDEWVGEVGDRRDAGNAVGWFYLLVMFSSAAALSVCLE